ncbi:MAG: DNA polymerase III subunit delta' [Candidatus Latescibacterota bacterium]|nr:MAG: DNA polymerase III subunit delta' [Candidatus Latescibacterota bacterium]
MKFWDILIDQAEAKKLVRSMFSSGMVPHALLVHGPEGSGKHLFALALAQTFLCESPEGGLPCGRCRSCSLSASFEHPDLHILWPAPSSLSPEEEVSFRRALAEDPYAVPRPSGSLGIAIDRVRGLQRQLSLRPYRGRGKVGILFDAECMRPEAANALLKTLEEPPQGTLLVLTSSAPERLLPTVRSRCQEVPLHPLPVGAVAEELTRRFDLPDERAVAVARASEGNMGKALKLLGEEIEGRAREFLESALKAQGPLDAFLRMEEVGALPAEELLGWVLVMLRDELLESFGLPERRALRGGPILNLSPEKLEAFLDEVGRAYDMLSKNIPAKLVLWHVWLQLRNLRR